MRTLRSTLGFAAFCLVLALCSAARAGSFTLQHGVGGYLGGEDSYVTTSGYNDNVTVNFGSDTNLLFNSEHYNGG
jgi:hypothetical protein